MYSTDTNEGEKEHRSALLVIGSVCIYLNESVGNITTFILAIGSFCWTMFYGKNANNDEKTQAKE